MHTVTTCFSPRLGPCTTGRVSLMTSGEQPPSSVPTQKFQKLCWASRKSSSCSIQLLLVKGEGDSNDNLSINLYFVLTPHLHFPEIHSLNAECFHFYWLTGQGGKEPLYIDHISSQCAPHTTVLFHLFTSLSSDSTWTTF